MRFIQMLERKFGRYAIRDLMKYVIALYAIGLVIFTFNGRAYIYLGLDIDKVLKGQVWRLITFLIPYERFSIGNILFLAIKVYVFYMIGNALENAWGAFKLNLYFFSAVIFNIIAAFIVYGIFRVNILGNIMMAIVSPLDIIYSSMFFAFAAMYPNMEFLVYFIIPVRAKYLAWINGAFYIYDIIRMIINRHYIGIIPIVVSLANFIIFYFITRDYRWLSPREIERRARFRRQVREGMGYGGSRPGRQNVITKHKCAVCGRTELDGDDLEFRFCSKCDGNYEYCMDHLYTHEHVKKHN